ncbi:MAG: DsrE family protein [Candidatus Thermoplasmatota archaeon]|nr:DsrE family protein [Candidatus Thermoplasmatota archaeon]
MGNEEKDKVKRIAFLVTIAPGDTARLETMLGYALAAAAIGYEMMMFFALDSALVAKQQVFDKMEPKVRERIRESIKEGIEMNICSASAQTFGIKESDLIEGAKIGGIASFYFYAEDADIVLTWN